MKRYRIIRKTSESIISNEYILLVYKIQIKNIFFWFTVDEYSYTIKVESSQKDFHYYDGIVSNQLEKIKKQKSCVKQTTVLVDTGKNKQSDKSGALSFPEKSR